MASGGQSPPKRLISPWLVKAAHCSLVGATLRRFCVASGLQSSVDSERPGAISATLHFGKDSAEPQHLVWSIPQGTAREELLTWFGCLSPAAASAACACPAQGVGGLARSVAAAGLDIAAGSPPPLLGVVVSSASWKEEAMRTWEDVLSSRSIVQAGRTTYPSSQQRPAAPAASGSGGDDVAGAMACVHGASGCVPGDGDVMSGLVQWTATVDEPVLGCVRREDGQAVVADSELLAATLPPPSPMHLAPPARKACSVDVKSWWEAAAQLCGEVGADTFCTADRQKPGDGQGLAVPSPRLCSPQARRGTLSALLDAASAGWVGARLQDARGASAHLRLTTPGTWLSKLVLVKLQLVHKWWQGRCGPDVQASSLLNTHISALAQHCALAERTDAFPPGGLCGTCAHAGADPDTAAALIDFSTNDDAEQEPLVQAVQGLLQASSPALAFATKHAVAKGCHVGVSASTPHPWAAERLPAPISAGLWPHIVHVVGPSAAGGVAWSLPPPPPAVGSVPDEEIVQHGHRPTLPPASKATPLHRAALLAAFLLRTSAAAAASADSAAQSLLQGETPPLPPSPLRTTLPPAEVAAVQPAPSAQHDGASHAHALRVVEGVLEGILQGATQRAVAWQARRQLLPAEQAFALDASSPAAFACAVLQAAQQAHSTQSLPCLLLQSAGCPSACTPTPTCALTDARAVALHQLALPASRPACDPAKIVLVDYITAQASDHGPDAIVSAWHTAFSTTSLSVSALGRGLAEVQGGCVPLRAYQQAVGLPPATLAYDVTATMSTAGLALGLLLAHEPEDAGDTTHEPNSTSGRLMHMAHPNVGVQGLLRRVYEALHLHLHAAQAAAQSAQLDTLQDAVEPVFAGCPAAVSRARMAVMEQQWDVFRESFACSYRHAGSSGPPISILAAHTSPAQWWATQCRVLSTTTCLLISAARDAGYAVFATGHVAPPVPTPTSPLDLTFPLPLSKPAAAPSTPGLGSAVVPQVTCGPPPADGSLAVLPLGLPGERRLVFATLSQRQHDAPTVLCELATGSPLHIPASILARTPASSSAIVRAWLQPGEEWRGPDPPALSPVAPPPRRVAIISPADSPKAVAEESRNAAAHPAPQAHVTALTPTEGEPPLAAPSTAHVDTAAPSEAAQDRTQHLLALHRDVLDMAFQLASLAAAARQRKASMVARLQSLVRTLWPASRVEVFGSVATELDLPGSDVDVVVCDVAEHYEAVLTQQPSAALIRLEAALVAAPWTVSVKAIPTASVPVLRVVAGGGGSGAGSAVHLDITFDAPTHRGISTAAFVRQALRDHPALGPVTLVLKQLLATHNLNDPFLGGLSSYATILLVASVLADFPHTPRVVSGTASPAHGAVMGTAVQSPPRPRSSTGGSGGSAGPPGGDAAHHSAGHGQAVELYGPHERLRSGSGDSRRASAAHAAASVATNTTRERASAMRQALAHSQRESTGGAGATGTGAQKPPPEGDMHLGAVLCSVLEVASRLCASAQYWALNVRYGVLHRRDGALFRDDPLVIVDPIQPQNNVGRPTWGFAQLHTVFQHALRSVAGYGAQSASLAPETAAGDPPRSVLGRVFGTAHHRDVTNLLGSVWNPGLPSADPHSPAPGWAAAFLQSAGLGVPSVGVAAADHRPPAKVPADEWAVKSALPLLQQLAEWADGAGHLPEPLQRALRSALATAPGDDGRSKEPPVTRHAEKDGAAVPSFDGVVGEASVGEPA